MKNSGLLLAFCLSTSALRAEIIYDNSENPEGKFNDSRLETADQVNLAGEARLLTEFAFEYFGGFTPTGDETGRVRLYLNDAFEQDGLRAPGTLLYDSGPFAIDSGYRTIRGTDLEVLIGADTFSWSVEFSGVTAEESVGLLNYDPPSIGSSGEFFWQKENGIWQAVAAGDTGNNFAARFIADPVLTISRILRQAGSVSVSSSAIPGRGYALEYTRSLTNPAWTRAAGGTVRATSTQVTLDDPGAGQDSMRFYRIVHRSTSIRRTNNQATITTFAIAGRSYALESTGNFGTWTRLNTTDATGQTVTFNVPTNDGAFRFFRVIEI